MCVRVARHIVINKIPLRSIRRPTMLHVAVHREQKTQFRLLLIHCFSVQKNIELFSHLPLAAVQEYPTNVFDRSSVPFCQDSIINERFQSWEKQTIRS